MKRLHVHNHVADLDASIAFYRELFAAEPDVVKSDYAKWMLEDPRVNFAISTPCGGETGIQHVGIQVEAPEELGEVYRRLEAAERPTLEESGVSCCYAKSDKRWVTDPDGVVWETFLTRGETTVYGESAPIEELADRTSAACGCA